MDTKAGTENSVLLSVIVTTYNHEKYIAQALDSILQQKVDFPIEVLVGEDKSTDNTKVILQDYEKRYPGFFTMFYREENMNDGPVGNDLDLRYRSRGKYVILLEGDDYWTDPFKLQKQVDFLETHPDYIAVAHNCIVVDENSNPTGETYPECHQSEYTLKHYASGIVPGQTTTMLMRNFYIDNSVNLSLIRKRLTPGDRCTMFTLVCNGRFHCIQEQMSAYRHVIKGGSSFSANYKPDFARKQELLFGLVEYSRDLNNTEALRCAEYLYFKEILFGLYKSHSINKKTACAYLKRVRHFPRALVCIVSSEVHRKVFRLSGKPYVCI